MQRLIVHILIFIHLGSFFTPFIPSIIEHLSKLKWELSHQRHISQIEGRVSILSELADIAKHNNPKKENNQQHETVNLTSATFTVSSLTNHFSNSPCSSVIFSHYTFSSGNDFGQNASPPPKLS